MKLSYFGILFLTLSFNLNGPLMSSSLFVYSEADLDFETIELSPGLMSDRPWRRKFRQGKRPSVFDHPDNRSVVLGRGVTFHCRASGKPKLRIKWKKNGVTITQTERIKIRDGSRGNSRLRIRNVQRSDSGYYSCLAKNRLGHDSSNRAYLHVRDHRKPSRARCEPYTGSICSKYISASTKVFISPGHRQRTVEGKLSRYLPYLDTYLSRGCADHVNEFECLQSFRSCKTNDRKNRPQQICREDCQLIERGVCRTDLKLLKLIPAIRRRLPSCKNLPSARGKTKCVHLSLLGNTTSKSSNNTGKCEPYKGTVCSQYIAKGKPIFVLANQPQEGMEQKLQDAISVIDTFASKGCKKFALKGLCYHFFPPCAHDYVGSAAEPQLICRKDCELLQATVCSKEFELAQAMTMLGETLPDCFNLPPSGSSQEKNCLELGIKGNKSITPNQCPKYTERPTRGPSYTEIRAFNGSYSMCYGSSWKVFKKFKMSGQSFHTIRNVKDQINKGKTAVSRTNKVPGFFGSTSYCFKALMSLGHLVREWDHYHKANPLPRLRKPQRLFQISGLELTADNSGVKSILVPLGTAVTYIAHAKLRLDNVTFSYLYENGFGTFIGRGNYDLCGTIFKVNIRRLKSGVVMVSGQSNSPLDVSSIENVFGLASPSAMLVNVIRRSKLLTLRLVKPQMELYLDKDLSAKFAGRTFLGQNASPVYLEIFAGKLSRRDLLVAGITTENLSVAQAIEMFTGLSLPYIDLLQAVPNASNVGVSISTRTVMRSPQHRFSHNPLSALLSRSIPEGLSFVSRNAIPAKCNGSQVCQLLQVVFGKGSQFSLTTDTDWRRIIVNTEFTKLDKSAMANIHRVHVAMKIVNGSNAFLSSRKTVTFKVDGDVHYQDNPKGKGLQFNGKIDYNRLTSVMQGQFSTDAIWIKAFGFQHLTFKNLRFGMTLQTRKPHVENIVRGEGDFELGMGCSTQRNDPVKHNCITGHAHLGVSDDEGDHYFYGSVSPINLHKLLQACGISYQLPRAVASIGFPNGLTISVAKRNHDLRPNGGPNLEAGFHLSGKMNVLGIETDAALSLLPREFLVNADISGDNTPVNIGGKTPLHDSRVDRKHGLKLYMKTRFDPSPFLKAHIDGYERVLGIFDEIRVLVTREKLQIHLSTGVHKSFKALVNLTTKYNSSLNTTHFKATVIFENGLSKLTRLASKNVITMLESEMTQLKTAEREVKKRRKECAQSVKRECRKCLNNASCKAQLETCHLINRMKRLRNPHNNNELRKFCQKTAVRGCQMTGATCKRACASIEEKANQTCKAFREASRAQHQLERGLKWVKQAESFMYSDLFKIHAISFEASFSQTNMKNIFVDTSLEITIFGQRHRLKGLKLKFKAFARLSSEIAKHAVDWYRKAQPRVKQRHMGNRPRGSS